MEEKERLLGSLMEEREREKQQLEEVKSGGVAVMSGDQIYQYNSKCAVHCLGLLPACDSVYTADRCSEAAP